MKGTVRKRESGKWAWQFTSFVSGERRHFSKGGFGTKKEAQESLTTALAKLSNGHAPALAKSMPTLSTFITTEWLPSLGALKETTRSSYSWLARRYVVPTLGHLRLSEVTAAHLSALYRQLRQSGGRYGGCLSESTTHKVAVVISSAFEHAVQLGLVTSNPASRVPRRNRPSPKKRGEHIQPWSAPDARAFLRATAESEHGLAWQILLSTGMRRGETAGLRWSDIDLDRSVIEVRNNRVSVAWKVTESTPKSGRGRRVSLDDSLARSLRAAKAERAAWRLAAGEAWEGTNHDLVLCDRLGRSIHPETLTKAFARAVKGAGVPSIRLHDLRHTHATLLLADGVAAKVVQERLGHSSISVTLDLYGHVTAELEQAAADRIGSILGASSFRNPTRF